MTVTKNRLPLITLYVTTFLSVTGNALAAVAIPWFVLETTGSAAQTGITAFASIVPSVIALFFGGVLVDRVGYKRASVVADVASGITIALIPLLYQTVGLAFWQLLALVFLGALLDAPGNSARYAMLPELATAAGIDLDRATALNDLVNRATTMVGAPLAGLLIALIGTANVLWIDAVSFAISALGILIAIPAALVVAEPEESTGAISYWHDLREGLRFVRADALVFTLILVVMVTNMIDFAYGSVVLPVYVRDGFGETQGAFYLGILLGAFGVCAVLGNLLYSWRGSHLSKRWLMTIAFALLGLRFLFFIPLPPLWVLLAVQSACGFLAAPLNPIISAALLKRTPKAMRARVFGTTGAGVQVAMPIGALVAGFLLEATGMTLMLTVFTLVYLIAVATFFVRPSMSQLDHPMLAAVGE